MSHSRTHTSPEAPTVFVIFGAFGDLSEQKLLPALFDLWQKKMLPKQFRIVGFSRRDARDADVQAFASSAIAHKHKGKTPRGVAAFCAHLHYVHGIFEDPYAYERVAEALVAIDEQFGVCSNKLFYLAVPPNTYGTIFENLAHSGLTIPCGGNKGWTRILVEKPFGRDLATAQKLDVTLGLLFKEEQIFRIDHYLAKENLQNILAFRFSNALFEPLWRKGYIEKVEVRLWETAGIGRRGGFYEDIGALRDVGQNHMLQMLALVAMDDPQTIDPSAIRAARARALVALRPIHAAAMADHVVRGQYQSYRREAHVDADSRTETYVRIKAYVDNERWSGVPFYLEAGKRMKENRVDITLFFKKAPSWIRALDAVAEVPANTLTFRIQPDEGIILTFLAKRPGFGMALESKSLSFSYGSARGRTKSLEAYERILFDCIQGDQTLFASTAEVAASWGYITPILTAWGNEQLHMYEDGSLGPAGITK
ncbi:MAG: glucose-6-phosphate dehydrogenase [Candidatus Ryanbacteria bacterium RIFCSPHIGHO2_01_FULL_48_27]|uniref:Glucose-6-phosphate 1-dehydrogenase n=1 Tax=Candidatus Ryanbacteria bacterium RIFCSPHIGHO2_01_FULL_48_27 TaxID=1802115 RepID=A0A1G2G665_9BACT|nr:MAG: glucose-6-phosphate dehydrogenase [Candidatus Ryanbacteria bacterium RIFCSPHIGHO2_01_FULL_48_27]